MSMIVLHTNIADNELREAVREAVKGEIAALTRETLSEIVKEEISKKVSVSLSNDTLQKLFREEVREQLKFLARSEILVQYPREETLKSEFRVIVKEVLAEVIGKSLRPLI